MAESTPVAVYEHDLREVVSFLDKVKALTVDGGVSIEAGSSFTLWSKNDYTLGTLEFEAGQWLWVLPPDAVTWERG